MVHILNLKWVKVIILYRFAKFESFKANYRKAMIIFRFYAN